MKTVGITLGDQAGIGPEVVASAMQKVSVPEGVNLRIVGETIDDVVAGVPTQKTAQVALDALEEGAAFLKVGKIDAIVTAPVSKKGLHEVGFRFPGQTEFFAERMDCDNHAMCLTGANLTVALVTIHIPLADVPQLLSQPEIVRVGKLLADFTAQKVKRHPRIAVCGLNPHAGENEAFGKEDQKMIIPAIAQLSAEYEGADFFGPHPPDTIFRLAADGEYDAVLCMYHDQGLIPLKLIDFDTGVNTTLGLARPRTSPDHGTAFGIAGQGIASDSSMQHAIQLAIDLVSS